MSSKITVLAAVAMLTACTMFQPNVDINHPIQPRMRGSFTEVVPLFQQAYPEVNPKEIQTAFKRLRYSESVFAPFTGYGDWANHLAFEDIGKSIGSFPENPYAWALLANYLGLERQPTAAIAACDRTLRAIDAVELRKQVEEAGSLKALRLTTIINRAMFLSLTGDFTSAQTEVREVMDAHPEEAVLQLAVIFVNATALLGQNEPADAVRLLDSAEARFGDDLPESALFSRIEYPQFFDKGLRHAVFAFLRGEALLRLGHAAAAEKVLRESIKSDDDVLGAKLALGTALYAQGRYKESALVLEDLLLRHASTRLYTFNLAVFNLGNVYAAQGKPLAAATRFRQVISLAERGDKKFSKRITGTLPSDIKQYIRLAKDQRIVAEAYNNLGTALLDVAANEKDGRATALEAIGYFRRAQTNAASVADVNIARAQALSGDERGAIQTLREHLKADPSDAYARKMLIRLALRSTDRTITHEGLIEWMDTRATALPSSVDSSEERLLTVLAQSPTAIVDVAGPATIRAKAKKALDLVSFESLPTENAIVVPRDDTGALENLTSTISEHPLLDLRGKTVLLPKHGGEVRYVLVGREIRLSSETEIVTNGNDVTIFAHRLEANNARVVSFADRPDSGAKAELGRDGVSGGKVIIHVDDEIVGDLFVGLRGQDGGNGADGHPGEVGGLGSPGVFATNSYIVACNRSGGSGGDGLPGGRGEDGQSGGRGGDGGRLYVYVPSTAVLSQVHFSAEPGNGGTGGKGGIGGPGGPGGPGGSGSKFCSAGTAGNTGPQGLSGIDGRSGAKGNPGDLQVSILSEQTNLAPAAKCSTSIVKEHVVTPLRIGSETIYVYILGHPDLVWVKVDHFSIKA